MTDWIENLERLKGLREQGHLSDAEFEAAKARVLGKSSSNVANTTTAEEVTSSQQIATTPAEEPSSPSEVTWTPYEAPEGVEPRSVLPKVLASVVLVVLVGVAAAFYGGLLLSQSTDRVALVSGQDVNCRTSPSTSGAIKQVIAKGTTVNLGESEDGWAKASDSDCWIKESKISVQTADRSTSAMPAQLVTEEAGAPIPGQDNQWTPPPVQYNPSSTCAQRIRFAAVEQCIFDVTRLHFPNDTRLSRIEENLRVANNALNSYCPGRSGYAEALYSASSIQVSNTIAVAKQRGISVADPVQLTTSGCSDELMKTLRQNRSLASVIEQP